MLVRIAPCVSALLLAVTGFMVNSISANAAPPRPGSLTLWYTKPAAPGMNEALPIGNGRLGGLIYGAPDSERVVFNEDSLWTGDANPSGVYESMGAYQKFAEVHVELAGKGTTSAYRRDLDIEKALAHVQYAQGGVRFTREYLASHPAQALLMHFGADKPGSYTGKVLLQDTHAGTVSADGHAAVITLRGLLTNGIIYEAQLHLATKGGTVAADGNALTFTNCSELTIAVTGATSYSMDAAGRKYLGTDPHERISRQGAAAVLRPYTALKSEHIADYQKLFSRVKLNLGNTPAERAALPTDERKLLAAKGGDPELEALLYQFGRYLLIGCSRPGSLPANLQGLWNDSNTPPWSSDYHANINVQMNYWPAEVAGLPECHTPLFDLVKSQLADWRIATAAAPEYKLASGAAVRGWALRTSHNITGGMGWNWDKTANAWYCLHFWEHYAFTGDKAYLKNTAYPVMKEITEFWEDHLKALPDGRLVVPDGWSPEHGPVEDGCSYNQEIVWDLFTNYVQAATELGVDADYRKKIEGMRNRLVTPAIGRWGQLQEWMTDRDDEKDHHRHTSHLFGVYPGRQFSVSHTPELAAAAKKSLIARSDSDDVREWSFAWRTALYARLQDGDAAYGQVLHLFSARDSCPNLFGLHPPMQIDGNFGITAGIAEMLLQSHAAEIELLPALPKVWKSGSATGLRARGGFVVDQTWQEGQLKHAVIHSLHGGVCTVRLGDKERKLNLGAGAQIVLNSELETR